MDRPKLLIHGGAGTLPPDRLTPEKRQAIIAGLQRALRAGHAILAANGPALDAVCAAVAALEDDPNFNAGHGAVFTSAATIEMDAAVMDGDTGRVAALAGICGPKNPILAARLVMERSDHILLAGSGAEAFLREQGHPFADDPAYFATPDRRAALEAVLRARGPVDDFDRHGTVGAVALDAQAGLAAATSTGGMTGKRPGRIGDTPLPGAGTWADRRCAVSATGHGESFIRAAAAHEIAARIRLLGEPLQAAADHVLDQVQAFGGDGGLIALGRDGAAAMPFNSRGMYRGMISTDGVPRVAIYREELS